MINLFYEIFFCRIFIEFDHSAIININTMINLFIGKIFNKFLLISLEDNNKQRQNNENIKQVLMFL